MKQEKLEKAANKHLKFMCKITGFGNPVFSFIEGTKWQSKRMYSKKEVLRILKESRYSEFGIDDLEQWFKQFKK